MTNTDLIDLEKVSAWLDSQGLEAGLPLTSSRLTGGSSNVMFALQRGDSRWVLRRPTKVAIERANEGMRREYRILSALGGSGVPHPEVVGLCEDLEVLACVFYVMQQVSGVHPVPAPVALDNDADREALAFSMVDALARLHMVDWRAHGLADLGRPEHFHERQVSRWMGQLDSYAGRELDGIPEVAPWLEANRPATFTPTLMHGDYHMMNILVGSDLPARVEAVLDWETATIGDPLLDLAGFCEVWELSAKVGWPSRAALISRYAQTRGVSFGDLTYYDVLYHFRLAVLMEGIYQRSLRDPSRDNVDWAGDFAQQNVNRAVELIRR
jgi:aminoglycoside phosphotransferase (APT) family kinase protein